MPLYTDWNEYGVNTVQHIDHLISGTILIRISSLRLCLTLGHTAFFIPGTCGCLFLHWRRTFVFSSKNFVFWLNILSKNSRNLKEKNLLKRRAIQIGGNPRAEEGCVYMQAASDLLENLDLNKELYNYRTNFMIFKKKLHKIAAQNKLLFG